jgi:nucleotide-binding universal stress UspA family protein
MLMEKVVRPQAAVKYLDILVAVASAVEDEPAIGYAEDLAVSGDGHVTAMLVSALPDTLYAIDATYAPLIWSDMIKRLHEESEEEAVRLKARLDRFIVPFELRKVMGEVTFAAASSAMSARHADISVFLRPFGEHDDRRMFVIRSLFVSGRPSIVVPPTWKKGAAMRNVLIAWNASKEAARAVADAAPFLAAAENVRLVTVGARPSFLGHGDQPGGDIATHLARRGVKVEIVNLAANDEEEGALIAAEAKRFGADLLILGAYGHSRLREMVFGGVTKYLLVHGETPMLFSH